MTKKYSVPEQRAGVALALMQKKKLRTELYHQRDLAAGNVEREKVAFSRERLKKEGLSLLAMQRENDRLKRELAKKEHDILVLKQLLLYH